MRKTLPKLCLLLSVAFCIPACEKPFIDSTDSRPPTEVKDGINVRFSVSGFEQIPFDIDNKGSRSGVNIKDVCSRLSFVFYKSDGTKYDAKHQESTLAGFGTLAITLPSGAYKLIVIAHNGKGIPTFDDNLQVKFKDNKVTDTFYCCEDIEVSEGKEFRLQLKRCVAMFRLQINDNMPSEVSRMKFYYTGGSSTLNPVNGYGCVNSRQTEYRDVTSDMYGKPTTFEVYSFPHAEDKPLKITVTALDASDNTIAEQTFEDVPIQRGVITQYKGTFFDSSNIGGGDANRSVSFVLDINNNWTQVEHTY